MHGSAENSWNEESAPESSSFPQPRGAWGSLWEGVGTTASWNIPWGVAQCPCGQSVKRTLLRTSVLTLQPVMHTLRTHQRQ